MTNGAGLKLSVSTVTAIRIESLDSANEVRQTRPTNSQFDIRGYPVNANETICTADLAKNPVLVSPGHISAVKRALQCGCFDILKAPCVFCAYSGKAYWQSGTHREGCPVRGIGGMAERDDALRGGDSESK